jgi:hypothetical protein
MKTLNQKDEDRQLTEQDVQIILDLYDGKDLKELVAEHGEVALEMHHYFVANQELKEKEARELTEKQKLIAMYGEQRIKDFEDILISDYEGEELSEALDDYTKKYVDEDIKNNIKTDAAIDGNGNLEIVRGRVH